MSSKFVIKHNGRNIIPLRNGEFEVCMPAPGELYITGRAVEKLATLESYPRPHDVIYAMFPGYPQEVQVIEVRFAVNGTSMTVKCPSGGDLKIIPCVPGKTFFWNLEEAVQEHVKHNNH